MTAPVDIEEAVKWADLVRAGLVVHTDREYTLARAVLHLHAEVERMRPVVEAAGKWRDGFPAPVPIGLRDVYLEEVVAVFDAVDAYRNATKEPGR